MIPLPSPEELKKYSEIDPNVVDFIQRRIISEQIHRHDMDTRVLRGYTTGYWISHIITLSSAAAGIHLVLETGVWPAVVLIPVGLTPSFVSLLLKKLFLSE